MIFIYILTGIPVRPRSEIQRIIAVVMLAGMVWVGAAQAGDLTPPGAPAPTMHTLTEIFNVVDGLQQQVTDLQQEVSSVKQRQGAAGLADTVGGMVLIPAGSFQRGDAFSEGETAELPVREITVSAFYMDQYPITKALWDEVRDWADSVGLVYTNLSFVTAKGPSHPVYSVSWFSAVKWANARSERDGLTPVYYTSAAFTTVYRTGLAIPHANWAANGYRLPTEAEWEKRLGAGCRDGVSLGPTATPSPTHGRITLPPLQPTITT